MPNLPQIPDRLEANGHYRHGSHLRQDVLDSSKVDGLQPSPQSTSFSDGNEWSSVTKDTIDTVPRVWTRGFLYFLAVFTAIALPWAMLSEVDEVGSARGRLEPKGNTFKIDAPVEGQVAEIKVKEGQTLKAGQVLLELGAELMLAELRQAQAELEGHLERLSRLEMMKNQLLEVTVRTQQQQGRAEAAVQLAGINEVQQRLEHSRVARGLASDRLARDLKEVKRYEALVKQGVIAEVQLVQAQRAVDEEKWKFNQANLEMRQAEYQLKAQQNQYQSTLQATKLTLLETERRTKELETQIASVKTEIVRSRKQVEKLKFQLHRREIRTPISGVLFQLPIQRPGAVVHPGQMIARVAPKGVPLVLKANMNSSESGFIKVGMPVKIKFDAYPFQDYGIVEGRVSWISPDSKMTETSQGSVEIFELEVSLAQPYIQTASQHIVLTPGQAATAEVIVRQRRIIDFLLDPFKKLQEGGLEL
ncbi:HlyD family efflux transporter periplasmic adaptor subunit [Scytonema sp. UIC 10036]|uniref:HlyD family efflux transporter periplasmic adaptor subunit n=1 Tax=Scytonema sp. UIC 10036 TaxID=2304196 RepID=UPI0012DA2F31|nr:HlyD family efflux transporter periplasmic adaptor subunit [Scytonema sp. UIC 10036]MUG94311.1 HlyD family efflux transporter periplasmic adaptor subunit [Scytonema sp. UIC 10036]